MTATGLASRSSNQNLASALREAEERYIQANPKSAAIHGASKAAMPGGNTRTTLHYSPFPVCIRFAEGSRVIDVDGHSYVDFINEYTAGVLGHSEPAVKAALAQAIADGLTLGGPSIYEHELSAIISQRFSSMERLRFCNSGTEANLLALATARAVTGRPAVLVFDGAYHGSLLYFSHGASPLNMPIPFVTAPYNDAEAAVKAIERHAQDLAAVLVEPLQGGAGAIPGELAFMRALRDATRKHGIVFIMDEVMTSRLSPSGVQGRLGIKPDMTTLGKYVGGGMTIGAFGGRADIMERFDPAKPGALPHGGTFNNNVLAMAAGHAAFTKVLTPQAIDRMNAQGDDLRQRLDALAKTRSLAVQTTGLGSIFAIHFHRGTIRNGHDLDEGERGREREINDLKTLFQLDMMAQGHYINRRILGNLSLQTSAADLASFLGAFEEFLDNRAELIRATVP
ncbi:MAG TPA: aminotransferase class III-fold pyridoxal phosphate-dependent enzyme [Hypericibacter adhaerens]|uniref:aspartate aminotransferase family protein n=1 Tax=Hypericibacter adhaerens TaxID=2602016 RepID=UPI002CB63AEF|nr:aminotransferase class III-fold pyridoxal phosphate-dependent enzyme [Hypericibacter adhaerens]HWA43564.1 aminotransferase class III-fold pyridoxal phosphate-dependent enzyme [Hypericibacter adhaerens]